MSILGSGPFTYPPNNTEIGVGSYYINDVVPIIIPYPASTGDNTCDSQLHLYVDNLNAIAVANAENKNLTQIFAQAHADWSARGGIYGQPGTFVLNGTGPQTQGVYSSFPVPFQCYTSGQLNETAATAGCQQGAQNAGCLYYKDWVCDGVRTSVGNANCSNGDNPRCNVNLNGQQYKDIEPLPSVNYQKFVQATPSTVIQCCNQRIDIGTIDNSTVGKVTQACNQSVNNTTASPTTTEGNGTTTTTAIPTTSSGYTINLLGQAITFTLQQIYILIAIAIAVFAFGIYSSISSSSKTPSKDINELIQSQVASILAQRKSK